MLNGLPFEHMDYSKVFGACAENVIGYVSPLQGVVGTNQCFRYVPIPVGIAGPVLLDGKQVILPMATTEGCLIASTHRGCKAISESGGARTVVTDNGMSRAPLIRMPNIEQAAALSLWLTDAKNFASVAAAFNSTSRFARLQRIDTSMAGRCLYLRFKSVTGDAMGMNMVSKGVEKALTLLAKEFPELHVMR